LITDLIAEAVVEGTTARHDEEEEEIPVSDADPEITEIDPSNN
jgi:hypothetical protein